jgi:molecular chaperone HtpG
MLEAAGQALPPSRPWLELNPGHALVQRLQDLPDGEAFDDLAMLLHEQAALVEGGTLADPAGFVRRVNRLIGAVDARGRIITPDDRSR